MLLLHVYVIFHPICSPPRPYFTYWVTTVQIVIVIVSIAFYGFAPIGFSYSQRTDLVSVRQCRKFNFVTE